MVAALVLADSVLLLTWVFSDPVQCFRSLSVSLRVNGSGGAVQGFAVSYLNSVDRVGGWSGIWRWSLRNNRKKNKAENLLGTLDLVYVWSITEVRVHCKIFRRPPRHLL